MVKNIGSVVGLFLTCVSAIGVMTKFQNKYYKRLFDEHSEGMRKNIEKQIEEIKKNDKKRTEEITEIKDTLNNLETKVDSLETKVETKVDSLEKRFDSLETKVDGLETKVDSLEKRSDVDENFNAEICRSAIKDIYYRYNKTQKIPLYERKMADSLYKIYSEQFHQNSYGQLLYQEICKWEIDPTDKLTM